MASLEKRKDTYRVVFMLRGRKYGYSLDTGDKQTAEALRGGVEKTLMLVSQGALAVPEGADVAAFVKSGGKATEAAKAASAVLTLAGLRDDYLKTHGPSLEANTLAMIRTHYKHLAATLKEKTPVASLGLADLQRHVDRRQSSVQAATIRMEIVSLRTAWNWAVRFGLLKEPFPGRGLRFPKAKEKPPFMTRAEIERRIEQGGDPETLWECLYLTRPELDEMLEEVRANAIQPWVYPMAVFAAHTGARRSELLRVRMEDVDLGAGVVTIREKKRRRGLDSSRRVPVSAALRAALEAYIAARPSGCPLLFCQGTNVARSKKKRAAAEAVTKDEAHNHLERALKGGRWEVVRGFHAMRHSCVSALANAGVDQRVIQDMVGHLTSEIHRRYVHLTPSTKDQAIKSVFG